MAQLRRLREQYPEELVIIGVHSAKFPSEQLTESIRQAVMRQGIEHPVVNDAGFKIWNAYAVRAWPTLVLIDPNGRIAGETSGEILAEDLAADINQAIRDNEDVLNRAPLDLSAPPEPDRPLKYPARVLPAGDRLFLADTGHHRILEIKLDANGLGGEIVRVFGSGTEGLRDGPTESARFHHPHGLGLRGEYDTGTLYVADTENHAIRAIDLATGTVRTLAGTGKKAHGRFTLGAPTEIPLRSPWAVLPIEEYLFIAMAGSHQIWVMIGEEQMGVFAGSGAEALEDGEPAQAAFNQPSDLALGMGHLFVADPEASAVRAIAINQQPKVMTLVGQGLFDWGDVDGPTSTALLQHPVGIAVEGQTVYVADSYNHKIKTVDPVEGQVQTLIGAGKPGMADGPFETAQLYEPEGVAFHNGLLYIADTNNHQVRIADLAARQVHTFKLRGLDRLPMPERSQESAESDSVVRLPVVAIPYSGARIVLDLRLPEGYKRNPDAPTILRADGTTHTFSADEPIAVAVQIGQTSIRETKVADLVVYYCEADDARLCLIHTAALEIPLELRSDAPAEAIVPYTVEIT